MIFDAKTNLAIDNLGWVDRGSLWTFDVVDRKEGRVPVADTSFIRVSKSKDSFFRLVYADKSGANLSIRHFRDPSAELAGLTLSDRSVDFRGDESLWSNFDKAVIVFTQSGQRLIWIDAAARSVTDLDISWFNNDNYDVGYSSLVDSLTLPGRRSVIVSAQRSSRLAIIDLERNKEVESFVLGDRSGNPHLHLLNDNELIADDYDTMCRVDIRNRKVIATAMLQPARAGVNQFIGHYDPHPNGTCAVARPFSGDVVLLDSFSKKPSRLESRYLFPSRRQKRWSRAIGTPESLRWLTSISSQSASGAYRRSAWPPQWAAKRKVVSSATSFYALRNPESLIAQ